jgi:hypothetical protein
MSPDGSKAAVPWPGADVAAWTRAWMAMFSPAPQTLTQPILPGWTVAPVLNITSGNSSAPQTEAAVLSHHSYGRQLGRVADVLQALIEERGPAAPADRRIDQFLEMNREIDAIKVDAAAERVDRLRADLAALQRARPEEYGRLRDELRRALDEPS